MLTRHFHATLLVIIGIGMLYILSIALNKQPNISIPDFTKTNVTPAISEPERTSFIYNDSTTNYENIGIYTFETASKQGIYGTPLDKQQSYSEFKYFNGQLYMKGDGEYGIVNTNSHSFYSVGSTAIPLTVSQSRTKALFIKTTTDDKLKTKTTKFELKTTDATISAFFAYPQKNLTDAKPLCWTKNEESVLFTAKDKALLLYSFQNTAVNTIELPELIKEYVDIHCNPYTESIFFTTKNATYKYELDNNKVSQVFADPTLLTKEIIFSNDQNDDVALVGNRDEILKLNLESGERETLYKATDSATLIPYLWNDSHIVFTQQSAKPVNGRLYLAGKVLILENQLVQVFARHEAQNVKDLGTTTPISWIEKKED